MGWTGSSDEGNNKCKWKLDRNGHAVKKGDCVGDLKMDESVERTNKMQPAVVKSEWELDYERSPHAYVNQRLQIQLELLMMSGMPFETC